MSGLRRMIERELPVDGVGRRPAARYRLLKTQLDADATRLRALLDRGPVPAVRQAYRDLDRTLGRAVAFTERLVPAPHRTRHSPPPLNPDRRQAKLWHTELRRLRDARERLRFQALDDPRARIPDTVRVATRAATGPPMPGLRVEEHRAELPPGNGMGVELAGMADRVRHDAGRLALAG